METCLYCDEIAEYACQCNGDIVCFKDKTEHNKRKGKHEYKKIVRQLDQTVKNKIIEKAQIRIGMLKSLNDEITDNSTVLLNIVKKYYKMLKEKFANDIKKYKNIWMMMLTKESLTENQIAISESILKEKMTMPDMKINKCIAEIEKYYQECLKIKFENSIGSTWSAFLIENPGVNFVKKIYKYMDIYLLRMK